MKSDLISRSELKIAVWTDVSKGTCGEYMDGSECSFTSNEVQKMIDEAPTVDAVPVVHGHIVIKPSDSDYTSESKYVCSRCNALVPVYEVDRKQIIQAANYCPNCGAKMDGKDGTK